MKKYFTACLVLIMLLSFSVDPSIYSFSIEKLNNTTVPLADYRAKRIIIAVVNPAAPNTEFLKKLDTIAINNNTISIIAVPAKELGSANTSTLKVLSQSFSSGFLFAKPLHVSKNAGSSQHPLFKWLTDYTENGHFDTDVVEAGQLFIINANGNLYSVLRQATTEELLLTLNQSATN